MTYSPYSELITKMQKELDKKDEEISLLKSIIDEEDPNSYATQEKIIKGMQIQSTRKNSIIREREDTIKVLEKENLNLMCEMVDIKAELTRERERPPQVIYLKEFKKEKKPNKKNEFEKEFNQVRAKILERDKYKCAECGSNKDLHIHHIVHRSDGGTNNPNNLVTLCKWCHTERHKGEPVYHIMQKLLGWQHELI